MLGTGDCLWGLLDGMNEDGLAVSLTFGGSREVGTGFGISIVMRYLLETCTTVAEALAVLDRVPVHMAYNVTVLDAAGGSATAFIGPGRPPLHVDPLVVTNHQEHQATEQFAKLSHSRDREVGDARRAASVRRRGGRDPRLPDPPTYNRTSSTVRDAVHGDDAAVGAVRRLPLAVVSCGASRSPASQRVITRCCCAGDDPVVVRAHHDRSLPHEPVIDQGSGVSYPSQIVPCRATGAWFVTGL